MQEHRRFTRIEPLEIYTNRTSGKFTRIEPLEKRLTDEASRLRKEAQGTPPGIERERLLRKARQTETAARMQEWVTSRGLQPPK
jgi:hypothetical protein